MKILHCINSPHIGGIERLVIELAIEQKRQGIEVSIMLDTKEGQYYQYLNQQNIPVLISGLKSGFDFNYKTYQQLKSVFNRFQIIHLHSFSPLRSAAAKTSRAIVVYTIHGLSKGFRREHKAKAFLREYLKKYFLNRVDVLIANSQYTLELAKKGYGLESVRKHVILNGIKLPNKPLEKENSNKKEFIIGLVSRFTSRKRIDRLITAFNVFLNKKGSGRLILVGDGNTFNTIKDYIKNLKLESTIELVGYKSNVEEYYNMFDICVFPSEAEPFGLVAVEAYIHGLPVIAFQDSGGLREVVEPLEPNNIVMDETELAQRLSYYANNQKEIEENRTKRINYAKQNFSVERMERDYTKVYNTLLK